MNKKIKLFALLIHSKTLDLINQLFDVLKWRQLKPEIDEIIYIDFNDINYALPLEMRKGLIKRFSLFKKKNRRWPNGRALKGNWDNKKISINEIPRIKILINIFKDYKDIQKRKKHIFELENWLTQNSKKNTAEVKKELNQIDPFYNSIHNFGFKTYIKKKFSIFKYKEKSGIRISIGRNGDFFWVGSHHRMAISKGLEIKKIPAIVMYRHYEWQKKRLEMVVNNSFQNYENHPDIQKFINE